MESARDHALPVLPPRGERGPKSGQREELQRYLGLLHDIHALVPRWSRYELAEPGLFSACRGEWNATRQRLATRHLHLVSEIASRYGGPPVSLDELIAEGNVGLLAAAWRFDPDRGVRFESYAYWWVRYYVVTAMRRAIRAESTPADDPEETSLVRRFHHAFAWILPQLPPMERLVLERHYGIGGGPVRTVMEIGESLGCTRERVREVELRALDRARELLEAGR